MCHVVILHYRTSVHPFVSILSARPEAGMAVAQQVLGILKLHHVSLYVHVCVCMHA